MINISKHKISDVQLSLSGFVKVFPNLVFYKNIQSVRRKNIDHLSQDVKLISGGGSGHEPAHVGYVGKGMLHSAICGDIFASPSVDKILNMILLTANPQSDILLIVKNYTGDRLNFGLALEIAKLSFGYTSIQILLVDDDCSIDESQVHTSVGRRGLAGTVLIHKIAGAMSELKFSRQQIHQTCRSLLDDRKLITMGFSFTSTLTSLTNIEIGKGIHGEPGVLTIDKLENFEEIVEVCYQKFKKYILPGAHICIMINNLGGTSLHLVNVFTLELLNKFNYSDYKIEKILTGCFLSSLSQEGLSVTLLDVSENTAELLGYLNHLVNVPAGLFAIDGSSKPADSESIIYESSEFPSEQAAEHVNLSSFVKNGEVGIELAKNILTFDCEALISCEDMLNKIDAELGDGDTGSTLLKGASAIVQHLQDHKINLEYPTVLLQNVAKIIRDSMGGTSGALYALFFQAAANAFTNVSDNLNTVTRCSNALTLGIQAISFYGLGKVGDRTMLDPLMTGEVALQQAIVEGKDVLDALNVFTTACENSAAGTVEMQPKSGRAAYSATRNLKLKYPDPGAHAVGIWCRALYEATKYTLAKYQK